MSELGNQHVETLYSADKKVLMCVVDPDLEYYYLEYDPEIHTPESKAYKFIKDLIQLGNLSQRNRIISVDGTNSENEITELVDMLYTELRNKTTNTELVSDSMQDAQDILVLVYY